MNQLDRVEQKLDLIMKELGIKFNQERVVKKRKHKTRCINKVEKALLLGFTRQEIREKYGNPFLGPYKKYDPKLVLGDTEKASTRRARMILDYWLQGISFDEICSKATFADNYMVKRVIYEYYLNFGIEDNLFAPLPEAEKALSSITYGDGNLTKVSENTGIPLVQVVRDYLSRGNLYVLDEKAQNILFNQIISAHILKMDKKVERYNLDPLSRDRILHRKPVALQLRWTDGECIYKVNVKGKYSIKVRRFGRRLWRGYVGTNGCEEVSDPEKLYKLLDCLYKRQIRGDRDE